MKDCYDGWPDRGDGSPPAATTFADSLGSADHGFSFDMTSTPYGKHVFKVYVIDDATGKQTLIGQGNITVNTLPIGSLDAADTKTVTGWAFDSDTPTKAQRPFLPGRQIVGLDHRQGRLFGISPTSWAPATTATNRLRAMKA